MIQFDKKKHVSDGWGLKKPAYNLLGLVGELKRGFGFRIGWNLHLKITEVDDWCYLLGLAWRNR